MLNWKAAEDFVETLLMLERRGESLETTKVAKHLRISKSAVHQMGHKLIEDGLITRKDYGDLALTEKGRELAEKVYEKHLVIKNALIKLGVSEKTAEEDCCQIEHVISEETFEAIKKISK